MSDKRSIDEEINRLVAEGANEEVVFRFLIRSFQKPLYNTIRKIVGGHHAADDVLQNVFLKVFKYWKSFRKESTYYSWIHRIAINESLTFIKRQKSNKEVSLDDNHEKEPIANQFEDHELWIETLQDGINTLPEKQKRVFVMRYEEDFSYEKISQLTDTSVGSLKASYHHAVKKIKDHFMQKGLLTEQI